MGRVKTACRLRRHEPLPQNCPQVARWCMHMVWSRLESFGLSETFYTRCFAGIRFFFPHAGQLRIMLHLFKRHSIDSRLPD
jgi:hypothetical protein